jgi:hypothetical protein
MEAKELRIGNYIHPLLDENEVAEICSIGENDLGFERLSDKEYFQGNAIKPIPLTKKWLLKFGFEKIIHIHGYTFFVLKSTKKTRHASISIYKTYTTVGISSCVHCENVHQLQNLYFALTNEELKLI